MVVRWRRWLGFGPQEVDGSGLFFFLAYLGFSLNCREEDSESGLEEPLHLLLDLLPVMVWLDENVRGYDGPSGRQAPCMEMMDVDHSRPGLDRSSNAVEVQVLWDVVEKDTERFSNNSSGRPQQHEAERHAKDRVYLQEV